MARIPVVPEATTVGALPAFRDVFAWAPSV
jgi:hypothetical protein